MQIQASSDLVQQLPWVLGVTVTMSIFWSSGYRVGKQKIGKRMHIHSLTLCWAWYNNLVFFHVCVCLFACFCGCFVFVWSKFERLGYLYHTLTVPLAYATLSVRGNKGAGMQKLQGEIWTKMRERKSAEFFFKFLAFI